MRTPEQERLRGIKRRAYFREYRRNHPQPYNYRKGVYKSHGTSMAYKGEETGLKMLVGSKKINKPCDLDWNGKLVDVKTAKPTASTNGGQNRWKFLLTQRRTADLFLLICKDREEKTVGVYLIPNKDIKYKNLSFSINSIRYKKYLLSL